MERLVLVVIFEEFAIGIDNNLMKLKTENMTGPKK
jgi:hypothetical protein